jgi:hypothetical protein
MNPHAEQAPCSNVPAGAGASSARALGPSYLTTMVSFISVGWIVQIRW